jgi:tetratricopeptide (TPR) repeat protein
MHQKHPAILTDLLFLALIGFALGAIYIPALTNIVVFDDAQILRDGVLRPHLLSTLPRLVTNLTYVGIDQVFAKNIIAQKVFNLALHGVVVVLLYCTTITLLALAADKDTAKHSETLADPRNPVRVGVALFALNPSAVYATAYLVQRSILLATFFMLLMVASFLHGLQTRSRVSVGLSFLFYGLAVLSKELAVMAVFLLPLLFIVVRRPSAKRTGLAIVLTVGVAALIAGIFLHNYHLSLLVPYEPAAQTYLTRVGLSVTDNASVLFFLHLANQLNLFFVYGLLWAIPNPNWLAIDLQTIFPSAESAGFYVPLALAFVLILVFASISLFNASARRRLVAVLMLAPMILFQTEIWIIRIQEPFAIYRSYLWAICLPGLLALALTHCTKKQLLVAGFAVSVLHGGVAMNRARTFTSDLTIWSDAIEKSNQNPFLRGFGVWRHYINRGAAYLSRGDIRHALEDFHHADNLGALHGVGQYNIGVLLQTLGQHDKALEALSAAESRNIRDALLKYRIGESLYALNRPEEALKYYQNSAALATDYETGFLASIRTAEILTLLRQFREADRVLSELMRLDPNNARVHVGMGMAQLGLGQVELAEEYFMRSLAETPSANAYYGIALIEESRAHPGEALKRVEQAISLDPTNTSFSDYKAHLVRMGQ